LLFNIFTRRKKSTKFLNFIVELCDNFISINYYKYESNTFILQDEAETVKLLKERIESLEKEKQLQNERHTELILEMAELKR